MNDPRGGEESEGGEGDEPVAEDEGWMEIYRKTQADCSAYFSFPSSIVHLYSTPSYVHNL